MSPLSNQKTRDRKKKIYIIHVYNENWWYSTKNIQSKYGIFSKDTVCVWII